MLPDHLQHMRELLSHEDVEAVRSALNQLPEAEIADLLFDLDTQERILLFRLLPHDIAHRVFANLGSQQQHLMLDELTQAETRQLLSSLQPDDRTHLFEELPGRVTQQLLNILSPEDLQEARKLLGYPPDSVGRLMTPDYVALREQWTIDQVLEHIRSHGQDSETMNTLYVVDDSWKLLDALPLRRFILPSPHEVVASIMDHSFVSLEATQDREAAVRIMERYDLESLPVVDSQGTLIGVVTFDDVMDVAEEENTEDFHKSAAVSPLRGSYREATIRSLYNRRIGWLLVLVFANIFSGAAIAHFESMIAVNIALLFFLPLLIASSGNAGSQAATLMIRALAMGDVRAKDWGRLIFKELVVSAGLGITMALAVSVLGTLRGGLLTGMIVALSMMIIVIFGSVLGTALPFVLNRLKLDPATASGPLITTLSDISGVVVYFSIAAFLTQHFG